MEKIKNFSAEKIKNFSAEKGKLPKIEYFKGVVYEGGVLNKKPHGVGKVTYKDGSVCEGIWKDGNIVYEGQLNEQGKPHGRGKEYYSSATYEGEMRNGQKHGKGIWKRADGSMSYNGEYKHGKRHGKGVMTYANGDIYDGQWKNDQKDGKGKLKYHNGDVFKGKFSKGKKHGKGTHTYAAGDLFKSTGEWKKGKKCGEFKNTYRVEVSEKAYYDNDELKSESHVKRERVVLNEDTDTEDLPPSKRRNVCVSPPKN